MNKLKIHGEIGKAVTLKSVNEALDAMPNKNEKLEVSIFSGGGQYFEGMAIRKALDSYPGPKTCIIEGLAASMATNIMMACEERLAIKGSYIMIHNPIGGSRGDYSAMNETAERLEEMAKDMAGDYSKHTGLAPERVLELMKSDYWMNVDKAIELGFIHGYEEGLTKVAAEFTDEFIESMPENIQAMLHTKKEKTDKMKPELIKALALDDKAEDSAIIAQVVALSEDVSSFKAKLAEKDELVQALSSKNDALQTEMDSFKAEKLDLQAQKMIDAMAKEANVEISDNVNEKLMARAKSYIETKDETRKEDMALYIKAYGVEKNDGSFNPNIEARDSIVEEQDYMAALSSKIDEIIEAKGLHPVNDFAKAKAMAETQIKRKGE